MTIFPQSVSLLYTLGSSSCINLLDGAYMLPLQSACHLFGWISLASMLFSQQPLPTHTHHPIESPHHPTIQVALRQSSLSFICFFFFCANAQLLNYLSLPTTHIDGCERGGWLWWGLGFGWSGGAVVANHFIVNAPLHRLGPLGLVAWKIVSLWQTGWQSSQICWHH